MSIRPKKFNLKFQYYLENKKELIDWFYKNQSQQQRKHLENRLFVVLYNSNDLQHWKMKAEIALLQKHISDYLENFEEKQLISLDFDEKRVFSDVLFVT